MVDEPLPALLLGVSNVFEPPVVGMIRTRGVFLLWRRGRIPAGSPPGAAKPLRQPSTAALKSTPSTGMPAFGSTV
jgi:hypothetical protein